jgi:hypothetical protein
VYFQYEKMTFIMSNHQYEIVLAEPGKRLVIIAVPSCIYPRIEKPDLQGTCT